MLLFCVIDYSILPTVTIGRRRGMCPNRDRPQAMPLGNRLKHVYRRYNSFSPNEITGTSDALKQNKKLDFPINKRTRIPMLI